MAHSYEQDHTEADGDALIPWISVSVLGEFVECPRAGIIGYERERNSELVEEIRQPNVNFQLNYELRKIEEDLEVAANTLWQRAVYWGILLVLTAASAWLVSWWLALPGAVLLLAVGFYVAASWEIVGELTRQRELAHSTPAATPDFESGSRQLVNWWALRNAEFDAKPYNEDLRDDGLKIEGRPWRILSSGNLRIPVIRTRYTKRFLGLPMEKCGGEYLIRKTHVVQIAALCHLLETCEGAESPYGILLDGDDAEYNGVAVLYRKSWTDHLAEEINAAQLTLAEMLLNQKKPAAPENSCTYCGLGFPRRYRPGESETKLGIVEWPTYETVDLRDRSYHSTCGDRFRWVPPHEKALRKGLPPYPRPRRRDESDEHWDDYDYACDDYGYDQEPPPLEWWEEATGETR